jgi:hypothetical protein
MTLFREKSGVFWVGTPRGVYKGVNIFDLKPYLPENISKPVTKIYEARNGKIFLGGYDGLIVLDKDRKFLANYGKESGFTKNGIRAFWEDASGNIWIGTYGNGLFCYVKGVIHALNKLPNNLIGNDVFSLARDRDGNILMTSNSGMRIVHETNLSDYLAGRIEYLIPFVFGEEDGILNSEFNGGFQNNFVTSDSITFYFPSIQGLVEYKSLPPPDLTHYLSLKSILLDGKAIRKGVNIPRSTKFITFEYEDVDFNGFENVHYQYRLVKDGNIQNWSAVQKNMDVVINYPEPGHYKIDFRRLDGRNLISPEITTYTFYVEPHFYETGWFFLFFIMVLILVITLILWMYLERKQRKFQQELDLKSTITELQLSSIQSQMNPHFMFNAMNVLVHMINLAPKKAAEEFAISFARLMRKVLEHSKKSFISIEDEISTIEDYLYIQKQRLGPDFDYVIQCPSYLRKIQIPTMIIQPLIENAIIHGVSQVDYPGKISVVFSGDVPFWQIVIADNGIGIHNGQKKSLHTKKSSFGISLVQKKLELLKTRYDIAIDIEFSEQNPSLGSGTVVTIKRL